MFCAVYHTPPSRAGATSWGPDPDGTGKDSRARSSGASAAGCVVIVVAAGVVASVVVEPGLVVDVVARVVVVDGPRVVSTVVPVHAAADTTISVNKERLMWMSLCVVWTRDVTIGATLWGGGLFDQTECFRDAPTPWCAVTGKHPSRGDRVEFGQRGLGQC